MSGNPLKIKKLIDVHFTPIKDDDKKTSLITKDVSFYFHIVRQRTRFIFGHRMINSNLDRVLLETVHLAQLFVKSDVKSQWKMSLTIFFREITGRPMTCFIAY